VTASVALVNGNVLDGAARVALVDAFPADPCEGNEHAVKLLKKANAELTTITDPAYDRNPKPLRSDAKADLA